MIHWGRKSSQFSHIIYHDKVAESNLDFYGLQLDSLEWNYTYIIRSVLNGQIRVSLLYYDMPEKKNPCLLSRQSPAVFSHLGEPLKAHSWLWSAWAASHAIQTPGFAGWCTHYISAADHSHTTTGHQVKT